MEINRKGKRKMEMYLQKWNIFRVYVSKMPEGEKNIYLKSSKIWNCEKNYIFLITAQIIVVLSWTSHGPSEGGSELTLDKNFVNESWYAIPLTFGENVNMESVGRSYEMKYSWEFFGERKKRNTEKVNHCPVIIVTTRK